MPQRRPLLSVDDGHFSDDGQSFVITRPDTPHPLVNVISTGDYGVAVAQTGAGCSWGRAPSEPVTRGSALFSRDAGGRALYLRDDKSGRSWSVGWQPLRVRPESYECVHGVGYTLITSQTEGIQAQWLVFVPCEEPLEVWRVRLRNVSKKSRSLSLWTAVEWSAHRAGAGGDDGVHDGGRLLLAKARPSTGGGWDGQFFHGCNLPVRAHALDRRALWGAYGSPEDPEALRRGRYLPAGTAKEPFAGLCVPFTLKPGEERSVLFTVGCAESRSEALVKARKFQDFSQVDHAWNRTQMFWDRYLSSFSVETPDAGFNVLTNTWLKYQALSQGLWGGRGPRDARIFLPLDSSRVRREILARATATKPLFASFSDVPWPVLLVDYLRESGEGRLLQEKVGPRMTLFDAASRMVREMASLPMDGGSWLSRFLLEWAEMAAWAVDEDYLPRLEKERARKLSSGKGRPPLSDGNGQNREISVQALEEACRKGRSRDAWDLYRNLAPLPVDGKTPPLFAPELVGPGEPAAAALFKAFTEGILGVRPAWRGLRVRPCLPPAWKFARVRREFRGALYSLKIRRDAAKPAGFLELSLNGRKVAGDVLPVMFGRKNEVSVVVGKAS